MNDELTPGQVIEAMPTYFQPDKAGNTNATIQFDLSGDQAGLLFGGGEFEAEIQPGERAALTSHALRLPRLLGRGARLVERGEEQPADHGEVLVELDPLDLAGGRILDGPVRMPGQGGGDQRAGQG